MALKEHVIKEYAQMWPREVYDIKKGKNTLPSLREALHDKAGVYVLYRDDHPYYIGKTRGGKSTGGSLFKRIRDHALNRKDGYYNFWNFFSAFVVSDARFIDEVEGLLIAAIGITANSATPKFKRIPLPSDLEKHLKSLRHISISNT